jgi:anti-sigma factor RsiW
MRCDQIRDRIGLLVDNELAPADRQAVAAHAAACPDCARHRDELERLRAQLRLAREPAPRALVERVRASLAVEASAPRAERARSAEPAPHPVGIVRRLAWRLQPYAREVAAVLIACVLSIASTAFLVQRMTSQDQLARDVLAAHVRSMLQDNAVQIASLDTHTVKPWFAGRLEFTPIVKDLSAEGFQLVGGRLDFVGGRRVAALVYRRRLHQISVFIWPAGSEPVASASTVINGYHVVAWSKAGMSIWTVSDINEAELRELQTLL